MKTLIAATLVALLAGCGSMGMHRDSSGRSATSGATSSGNSDYYRTDDTFHSWIN